MRVSDFELAMLLKKGFKILYLTFTMLLFFSFVILLIDKINDPGRVHLNYSVYGAFGMFLIVLLFVAFKYVIKVVKN